MLLNHVRKTGPDSFLCYTLKGGRDDHAEEAMKQTFVTEG